MKTIISFSNAKITTMGLLLALIFMLGCNKGENGIAYTETNNSTLSFSGDISVLIDSLIYHELISVSFSQGSKITGSFFQLSDGLTGIFDGDKNGNIYRINGNFENNINSNFNGSITLINNTDINFEIDGIISNKHFQTSGLLSHANCITLEGKYLGEEEVTITIEVEGEKETETINGSDYIYLEQQNCELNYIVPGTGISRDAEINGNLLTLSGIFIIPREDFILTKNEFSADATISNQYDYSFVGKGIAVGTYQSHIVKVTGNSKGKLFKQFDVAVGIFRGGSWWYDPLSHWIIPPELNAIKNQVLLKYPTEVIAKCFTTANQISNLEEWLNYIKNKLKNYNIDVILVGHSLGANAIRIGDFSNYTLFSRISIDPINPDEINLLKWEESANQRELTFSVSNFQGYYFNYLATSTDILNEQNPYGLLGHHINQTNEYYQENTNHMTIVNRIVEKKYVLEQVDNCIFQTNKIRDRIVTSNTISFYTLKNLEINSIFNYINK
jgi:hypothetical protein